jgi:arabinogalactan endo-1,4-beta-galactosidase
MEIIADGEAKAILYFKDKEKGMVLNKTNSNAISAAYGHETDDWVDQPVILFEAMVDYQGKTVPAIRVKVPARGRSKPANNMAEELDDSVPF